MSHLQELKVFWLGTTLKKNKEIKNTGEFHLALKETLYNTQKIRSRFSTLNGKKKDSCTLDFYFFHSHGKIGVEIYMRAYTHIHTDTGELVSVVCSGWKFTQRGQLHYHTTLNSLTGTMNAFFPLPQELKTRGRCFFFSSLFLNTSGHLSMSVA